MPQCSTSSPSRFSTKWRPPLDAAADVAQAATERERAGAREERLAAAGRIAATTAKRVVEAVAARQSIVFG